MVAARRSRTVQRRGAEQCPAPDTLGQAPTARKPPRRVLLRRLPTGGSGPGLSDDPANVVVPLGRGVPHVRATVNGDRTGRRALGGQLQSLSGVWSGQP